MKLARSVMWLSLLGLVLFTTTTSADAQSPKWLHGARGFAQAVELQRESRVSMVVYFYTDWCPYCRTLDEQYLSAPSVRRVLERTVAVRINPESGPAERQLAARYGVTGYPTFFIMNNESVRSRELQPFRKGGNHLTPPQFAQVCEEVIRFVPASPKSTRPDESAESLESASNRAVMNATRQTRGVQIVEVRPAAAAAPAKIKT